MLMEQKLQKYINWIAGILALAALAFAAAAIHDMQTSEGVGLYYALKMDADRLVFDMAVDLAALLGLLLLTILPCVLLKHRSVHGFFRMLTAFLAFMPSLSMAYLIHLFDLEADFSLGLLLPVLQTVAPLLCLLAAAMSLQGDMVSEDGKRHDGLNAKWDRSVWKKWYSLCCAAAILLAAAAFLLPSLQQLFDFILTYLLLTVCFDLWERLYRRYPALNRWGWILFGGLALRVIYVLTEIMWMY